MIVGVGDGGIPALAIGDAGGGLGRNAAAGVAGDGAGEACVAVGGGAAVGVCFAEETVDFVVGLIGEVGGDCWLRSGCQHIDVWPNHAGLAATGVVNGSDADRIATKSWVSRRISRPSISTWLVEVGAPDVVVDIDITAPATALLLNVVD